MMSVKSHPISYLQSLHNEIKFSEFTSVADTSGVNFFQNYVVSLVEIYDDQIICASVNNLN